MKNSRWYLYIVFLIPLILLLISGCIDLDLDITINSDRSGKFGMRVAASDPYYNEFVDEIIEDVLLQDSSARISESYRDNKKVADIELSFQDVSELSAQGFHISHTYSENNHYVEIQEIHGVPVSISLNMPGRIISSNGKASGSRVTWDRAYMNEPYWAESEEAVSLETIFEILVPLLPIIIIAVILLVVSINLLLKFRNKKRMIIPRKIVQSKARNYCRNCGMKVEQGERFCGNCGHPRESNKGLIQSKTYLPQKPFPVFPLIIALVLVVGIVAVLIIINTNDDDLVDKQTDDGFTTENDSKAYSDIDFDEEKEDDSIVTMEETVQDGVTEPETADEKPMSDGIDETEPEDEEPLIEYASIRWDGGMYEGQLKDGVPHGYGSWKDPTGKTYVGDFLQGEMTGYGKMIFPGGEKYIGDFLNGKGHGQGKMIHPDGRSISGTWINGNYQGD